jgi:hypothetical protein
MGYDPGPFIASRYYAVGFSTLGGGNIDPTAYSSAINSGLNSTECPRTSNCLGGSISGGVSDPRTCFFPAGKRVGSAIVQTIPFLYLNAGAGGGPTFGTQANESTMTYQVNAAGAISGKPLTYGLPNASLLSINQDKVISILQNGF